MSIVETGIPAPVGRGVVKSTKTVDGDQLAGAIRELEFIGRPWFRMDVGPTNAQWVLHYPNPPERDCFSNFDPKPQNESDSHASTRPDRETGSDVPF